MSHDSGDRRPRLETFYRHGRYYGGWKPEKYLFPIDAEELSNMDLYNKFFLVARQRALYSPELPQTRVPRIMDLGTGTSIWSIDVAESTGRETKILAVDLHLIQPERIPPEMTTKQFDIEEPNWGPLMKDCDLVYMRALFGSIRTALWPQIYRNIFGSLRPGSGYFERVEIDWVPRWDERDGGEIPRPSHLEKWANLLFQGLGSFGRDTGIDRASIRQRIENAGFVDFKEEAIRIYMGPWMSDVKMQEAANWFNLGFTRSVNSMSLVPMMDGLGLTRKEVDDVCHDAIEESLAIRYRTFFYLYIFTARRP